MISCSPGSSRIGFLIVLLDDSLLAGIFAAIRGVESKENIVVPGVVVSAFFLFTPDLT